MWGTWSYTLFCWFFVVLILEEPWMKMFGFATKMYQTLPLLLNCIFPIGQLSYERVITALRTLDQFNIPGPKRPHTCPCLHESRSSVDFQLLQSRGRKKWIWLSFRSHNGLVGLGHARLNKLLSCCFTDWSGFDCKVLQGAWLADFNNFWDSSRERCWQSKVDWYPSGSHFDDITVAP